MILKTEGCNDHTRGRLTGRLALFIGIAAGAAFLLGLYAAVTPNPFDSRDMPVLLAFVVGTIAVPASLLLMGNSRRSR